MKRGRTHKTTWIAGRPGGFYVARKVQVEGVVDMEPHVEHLHQLSDETAYYLLVHGYLKHIEGKTFMELFLAKASPHARLRPARLSDEARIRREVTELLYLAATLGLEAGPAIDDTLKRLLARLDKG